MLGTLRREVASSSCSKCVGKETALKKIKGTMLGGGVFHLVVYKCRFFSMDVLYTIIEQHTDQRQNHIYVQLSLF